MRSQWKRLALAACLSLSCAGATVAWYKFTEKSYGLSNETPLAQVSHVGEEVLRRPPTRLLWQQVNTGDNLYNGETVRTSAHGEMRIQFEDGRYIDLEPDSLIVLQKSKGEINLDLMEGSLFVNAQAQGGAAGGDGLVLKSKDGKVDLTGASASLSKGSGGRLDLQVLEGKAKMEGKDGRSSEVSSGKSSSLGANGVQADASNWKILSPVTGKPFFIDPDAEKPVMVRWQGLATNYQVSLWVGSTRKDVHEVAHTAKNEDAFLDTKLPLGKYWWHLVAKDPSGKIVAETPLSRLDLQARYAPAMIFPVADAEIPVEKSPFDLTFKWQKTEQVHHVQLEVAKEPSLKKLLLNKNFATEEQAVLPALKEGTYYWRMSAFYEGSDKPVVGKIEKFNITKMDLHKDPAQIVWALPEDKFNSSYVGTPGIDLAWDAKSRSDEIAGYRLKLQDSETQQEMTPVEAKGKRLRADLPKPGRYIASVEAYNKEGVVIGHSESRSISATEMPRLASPLIEPAQGNLQTNSSGNAEIHWNAIPGAKEYDLTLMDKNGKELAKRKYSSNSANLKNLMPGEYGMKLEAVDNWGRQSAEPSVRTLVVPDKSSLRGPKLKKIKVN